MRCPGGLELIQAVGGLKSGLAANPSSLAFILSTIPFAL